MHGAGGGVVESLSLCLGIVIDPDSRPNFVVVPVHMFSIGASVCRGRDDVPCITNLRQRVQRLGDHGHLVPCWPK